MNNQYKRQCRELDDLMMILFNLYFDLRLLVKDV